MPLRNNSYHAVLVGSARKTFEYPLFLRIGKTPRIGRVEKRCHPRIDLIDILSPRPAPTRKLENKLVL
jgi:hypothetical protein